MNVFHIFLFLAPNRSHLPVVRYMWLQNGAIFRLWHQKWCRFREWNFCRGIKIDAILITSSLIPSGKGRFLSSFQKNSAHLIHIWKPFCQPIRRGFLLQFLTATFATEKRHDFWKNFPSTLYRNFRSRKTTYFPKLFQKMFSPLYRTFSGKKRTHFFKKVFLNLYRKFFWANLNTHPEKA